MGGGHSQHLSDGAKPAKLGWDRTADVIAAEIAVMHTAREARPSASGRSPSDPGEEHASRGSSDEGEEGRRALTIAQ